MNAPPRRSPQNAARWFPALAAAALLGTVVVAGVAGGSDNGSMAQTFSEPTTSSDVEAEIEVEADTVALPETTEPAPVETRPDSEKVPLDRTLVDGVVGDDVARLQERLHELGFNPGPVDGIYGGLTIQSIWAYEKLVLQTPREQVTGRVTPDMWDRMQDHVKVTPRRPEPGTRNHTEVYLPEQVMAVFPDGSPVFVAHISHGTGEEWCREVTISPGEFGNEDGEEPKKEGRCGVSTTPGGVFTYHRKVEGHRQSALAAEVVRRGLSVRATERLVQQALADDGQPPRRSSVDPDVRRLQTELSERLGATVTIQQGRQGKGKLVINYGSLDELDGILEHIG